MNPWLQMGDYYLPTQNIAAIRLYHPVPSSEGGGTHVAVWLNAGTLGQPIHTRTPDLVFKGEDAKEIRRQAQQLGSLGSVTVLLEHEEPRAAAAGRK